MALFNMFVLTLIMIWNLELWVLLYGFVNLWVTRVNLNSIFEPFFYLILSIFIFLCLLNFVNFMKSKHTYIFSILIIDF